MDPDGHARRVLEFDKLLDRIAAEARSPGGRRLVQRLVPAVDPAEVRARQERIAEVRVAFDTGRAPWPLDGIHDLRPLLDVAERPGSRLEPLELRQAAETLRAASRLRRFLEAGAESLQRVRAYAAGLSEQDDLAARIERAILETGEIADNASPELRRVRARLAGQREVVLHRLEGHLKRMGGGPDAYVTVRSERFVIPVRADAGSTGIVHDRSKTGATLFVEPLDVVDANNELQALRDAENREIERILAALTADLGAHAEPVRRSLEALEEIDALHAAAQAAVRMRAASPRIGRRLALHAARHPLLEQTLQESGRELVPLDVDPAAARALVITGPNTGGKTVALKTVGLLALMHQSGLQVPASPDSELPLMSRVVADIGDEQSIEAAESTFSSHLRHVRAALEAAGSGLLALFDEFMAGTDPEDGAALAKVVLRRLCAAGATTFVTTHLGALKLFAHAEPDLGNASMLFDPDSRVPLFRLRTGVPGSSNALATAARLGFDPALLEEARRERGAEAGRTEAVLQALEAERRQLESARAEAESAAAEARRLREESAGALAELTRHRETHLSRARREAGELVADARARIERIIRELRQSAGSTPEIRVAHEAVEKVEAELILPAAAPAAASSGQVPRAGDRVWIRSLQREGWLESVLADGRARVRLGNAEWSVPLQELEVRITGAEPPADAGAAPGAPRPGGYTVQDVEPQPHEIDLRGMDREGALAALDHFLDRATLQGTPIVRIVHGKGTGVLRKSIQEYLSRHANVEELRLGEHGEGGSGVTIVKLR
jgi:DNA mismatch repair protein MutS2